MKKVILVIAFLWNGVVFKKIPHQKQIKKSTAVSAFKIKPSGEISEINQVLLGQDLRETANAINYLYLK